VTVPDRSVQVTGVSTPYVAGQRVLVKAFLNGKLFKLEKLALKPSEQRADGQFHVSLSAPAAGSVSIIVVHSATKQEKGFTVRQGYGALDEQVGPGSRGTLVSLIQQRLSALHFYLPQTGVYDLHTELAVDAYHRLLGRGVSQIADPGVITAMLDGQGSFHVRFPTQGVHAEGDLSDQVLALTDGTKVQMLFPISSGKPSTPTVLGSWRVYERAPGYLSDGMYYSDFFTGGYAIHGYDPAPDYPASHGCMRLPISDAITAYDWLAIGDWVDTYYT
jgi:lipoprotein-anchoring transpeptidase ErfK/SrfK